MKIQKKLGIIILYMLLILFCTIPVSAKNIVNENVGTCSVGDTNYRWVLESGVHIRAKAGTNAVSLGTLTCGEKVFVLNSKTTYANGHYWVYVERILNGTKGWVACEFLR